MIDYIVKYDGLIRIKEFEVVDKCPVGLTADMFLTKDEIVYDIFNNRVSEEDKKTLSEMAEDEYGMQHFTMGMWIRNTYGLWEIDINPLVEENPEPDSITHPDNLSGEIMELVLKTIRGAYTPDVTLTAKDFDSAMKIVGTE